MVLKYADGRPDIPISHWHYDGSHHHHSSSRSSTKRHDGDSGPYQQQSPYTHTRSRSHSAGGGLAPDRDRLGRSGSHRVEHTNKPHEMRRPLTPQSPEEIRVWPSDSDDIPRQPRSKSLPRNSHFRTESPPPPMPSTTHTVPLQAMFTSPTPRHTHHIPPHNGLIPRSTTPRLAHPQPRPSGWHSIPQPPPSKGSSRAPPAIIYAPSNHSKGHYVPPHIVPSHAHRNAGGMKFSHSDPVRYHDHRYGDHYGEPFFRDARPGTADESARSRSRVTSSQESEPDSDDSGSTYYVMPTPGQKVHIIVSFSIFVQQTCIQNINTVRLLRVLYTLRPQPRSRRHHPISRNRSSTGCWKSFQ